MTREELFKNLKAGARWDVGVSINRSNSLPLDANSIFESYAAATAYASKDADRIAEYGFLNNAYIGQIIAVIEDKTVGEETVTTVGIYYIDANLTLQPVGKEVVADGNTIVNDNGTIKLYGFEAAGAATYPRKTADGKIEWVTVDQVVAGATKNTITSGDNISIVTTGSVDDGYVASLKNIDIATNGQVPFYSVTETAEGAVKSLVWKDVYTKAEVDSKIAGLLTYKGTAHHVSDSLDYIYVTEGADGIKADAANLGNVYIVGDKEYVSNGNKWEELGFTTNVDLSEYFTKTETNALIKAEEDRATAAENALSGRIATLEGFDHSTYALASDLEALDGEVVALSEDLTTLGGTVTEEQGKLSTLSETVSTLSETVDGHTATLNGLDAKFELKLNKSVYDAYVADRSKTDEEIANDINTATEGLAQLKTDVATLKTTVGDAENGLVKEVAEIKANTNTNAADIVTLKATINGAEGSEGLVTKISKLEQADANHKNEYNALLGTVNGHSARFAGMGETDTVVSLVNQAKTDAANAQTAADNAATAVSTLETGKVATNTENIAKLDGRLTTVEGDVATLKTQIGGLTGAMHFVGAKDEIPSDVSEYKSGDVILVDKKEYVFDGTAFVELGDEGSYAVKADTLEGYGITDAYTKTETEEKIAEALAWNDMQ